ncbi:MAG: hypothetical protein UY11_C0019G0001, partial [Candidatus Amesbacteria bacterium GW2011_GWC2_47_8]
AQGFGHPGFMARVSVNNVPMSGIAAFVINDYVAGDGFAPQALFSNRCGFVHVI